MYHRMKHIYKGLQNNELDVYKDTTYKTENIISKWKKNWNRFNNNKTVVAFKKGDYVEFRPSFLIKFENSFYYKYFLLIPGRICFFFIVGDFHFEFPLQHKIFITYCCIFFNL